MSKGTNLKIEFEYYLDKSNDSFVIETEMSVKNFINIQRNNFKKDDKIKCYIDKLYGIDYKKRMISKSLFWGLIKWQEWDWVHWDEVRVEIEDLRKYFYSNIYYFEITKMKKLKILHKEV